MDNPRPQRILAADGASPDASTADPTPSHEPTRHLSEATATANDLANELELSKGPRGTLTGSVLASHILMYWGLPHSEAEPLCQARAKAERELNRLRELANTLSTFDHSATIRHGEIVNADISVTEEWWSQLVANDWDTAHSKARNADEYIALLEPMPEAARGQRLDFAALKDRIDIVDYVSRYTRLRPSSGRFVGRCPLPGHEDSSPSFWVYPGTRSFNCFGCNRGGDVINFAQAMDGTSARDLAGAA